jgi:hypothetical protein
MIAGALIAGDLIAVARGTDRLGVITVSTSPVDRRGAGRPLVGRIKGPGDISPEVWESVTMSQRYSHGAEGIT